MPRIERGVRLSTPLALISAAVVVVAGAAFFATQPQPEHPNARLVGAPHEVEPRIALRPHHVKRPAIDRAATYVVVFNNSPVKGLAGRTAATLTGAGWNVVGSDNWYGTIPTTTVYYPARLARAGRLLAVDLGVRRVLPAIEPMQMDRVTVILTGELG